VGAGDAALLGVLADHVVGLPARDVHEVVGGAACREPAVGERAAEAVRVDVLNPRARLGARPCRGYPSPSCARCCDPGRQAGATQTTLGVPSACPDSAAAAFLPMGTQVSVGSALAFLVACGASAQSIGLASSCSPSLTRQPRDAELSLASVPPEVS
jgi:hypothetical protein